jgi:hypothetical protein
MSKKSIRIFQLAKRENLPIFRKSCRHLVTFWEDIVGAAVLKFLNCLIKFLVCDGFHVWPFLSFIDRGVSLGSIYFEAFSFYALRALASSSYSNIYSSFSFSPLPLLSSRSSRSSSSSSSSLSSASL